MGRSIFDRGILLRIVLVFVLAVGLAGMRAQMVHAASVRYAKPAASGSGNCSSWDNACRLQTALAASVAGDQIWVAWGFHTPTMGTTRTATFQLKNGVAIYGGFAGTEADLTQRDIYANPTILSCDLGLPGQITDNCHNVITGSGTDHTAILDGFIVRDGYADGGVNFQDSRGAGMHNNGGSPSLSNIEFINNRATGNGGGMFNTNSSSPILVNVTFSNNRTDSNGGGIYNYSSSSPSLTNVTFSGNLADYGGGMYNYSSSPTVTNVTFYDNSAVASGGGMYNNSSSPQIRNTILWGNSPTSGAQIAGGGAVVSDSVMQGGYAGGTNIISADPMLGPLGEYGGSTETIPLLDGSSAIDTGNDAACADTDQRGMPRPQGTHCDIGAFEVQVFLLAAPGGQTSGSCSTWATACELQYSLSIATSGQEIWVMAGTYTPTDGTDRTATFHLVSGVTVYGGFPNTGDPGFADRDPAANVTILSGDLNGDDTGFGENVGENSYHVVTGAEGATLDGVTITAGNADGVSDPYNDGAGMYNDHASLTVKNVIFSGNSASFQGGGMYNFWSDAALTDVTFSHNSAASDGGGMGNVHSSPSLATVSFSDNSAATTGGGMYNIGSSPTLTDVTFSHNSAADTGGGSGGGMANYTSSPTLTRVTFSDNSAHGAGGGLFNNNSSPTLTDVTFNGNSAESDGGGMFNYSSSPALLNVTFTGNWALYSGSGMANFSFSNPSLTNVTFSDNSDTDHLARYGGGMMNYNSSNPVLTHVTFSGNRANYYGGGIYNSDSSPEIRNTILWGNTANYGAQIYDSNSLPIVSDSVIQDGYAGGNHILTADPLLGTLGSYGGFTRTIPILTGSSAINTANPIFCTVDHDQRGVARPQGAYCDMGAFEGITEVIPPVVTSFSVPSPANSHDIPIALFSATDNLGVVGYLITTTSTPPRVDAAGWTGSAPTTYTVPADGTYTLYPWAKDADGNVSALFVSAPDISVDTIAPDTRIDSHPDALSRDPSPTFEFSSPDDAAAIFECQLDGGGYSACDSPKTYTGLAEQEHTFEVRAVDPAGNPDPDPASFTWTNDLTAPVVSSSVRNDANPTAAASVEFRVTFSESVTGVDLSDFDLTTSSVSGASVLDVSGTGSDYLVTVSTGSGNGTIRLNVSASAAITDPSGNALSGLPYTSGETYTVTKTYFVFLPLVVR